MRLEDLQPRAAVRGVLPDGLVTVVSITAVYEAMLPRQPLRFLLADDPGAGKTIMAGLLIRELMARGDLERCLIVCPGSLAEQWQDELHRRFQLPFEILTNDKLEAARTRNWFLETDLVIARLDKLSRDEETQRKLQAPEAGWDLVVCDEAHKLSATFFGGEVKYTKRYRLGRLLSGLTRHFLLMTATPHNGKEEDFQLFLALLDGDRFEGRFRDGVLRQLLVEYGPCLILIDEWVAYARQLHDRSDLPAGSFETQFTFAQALTESVKAAGDSLLVVSLPASDADPSPHAQTEDVEVGGRRGREALERLRNVIGRVESSWRPASAEEGFEIVRRRLFEPFTEPAQFKDRDVVARAFADLYRAQRQEFPPECRDAGYEQRIAAAYPIHPEIFDRLYADWSTLVTFQRTRGVLRLMASVIHSLWAAGDRGPLILPANLSIDDPRVQSELTRYLPDHWAPVIEKDVDGPRALPQRIDGEVANLGKHSACRRVARAVYLGSAPAAGAPQRGLEDRRIKLGCVLPGESPAVFGDALRRLAAQATHLYQDGPRYWYDTRPTVTKLAEDRAEQLRRDPDRVAQAIGERLREAVRETGGFSRIHVAPRSGHDVPDERETRLVVFGVDHPYRRETGSAAEAAAAAILESRGTTPRLYRNTLVFLAPDQTRLQDLDEAVRLHRAWESILAEREALDLSPHQVRQAETRRDAAAEAVTARLPETYQWLLTPTQKEPADPVAWEAARLTGQGALAARAARRLKSDDLLAASFAGTRLRMELDRVPLWDRDHDHVAVRQVVEYFASHLYLPRLQDPSVLLRAVADGVGLLTWEAESFGYADDFDAEAGRYRGLRGGQMIALADAEAAGVLVKPAAARRQMDAEKPAAPSGPGGDPAGGSATPPPEPGGGSDDGPETDPHPTRFHGCVTLDATRAGRDASQVADEVISHLAGLVGANVRVTLEIDAEIPDGAPDQVVRTVTENSRTLKFDSHGFERE